MTLDATATLDRLPAPHPRTKLRRLLSMDLLRGLTIAFMILVNNNGDGRRAYWPLQHAAWNGFTPTDLVFPTFLFLVGVSTAFSLSARVAAGVSRNSLFLHTLRRASILFVLGLIVNSFPHFNPHTLRVFGVLPRIAICYLIVATLYLLSPEWRSKAVLVGVALVGYWALMRFVPVPGYGVPTHTVPLLDQDGNLTAWLDRHIFSAPHLYEHTRDPEGFLSTLPALATALIGLLTGEWLRTDRTVVEKSRGIVIAGLSAVLLGGLWNFTFPINKKLWTSSFVLFAAGWSLLLLALSMAAADVREESPHEAAPDHPRTPLLMTVLLVFGMNAIASYVLSELLQSTLGSIHLHPGLNVQQWLFQGILALVANPALASLLYSLAFVAVCWLPMFLLYRKRVFIKI